MRSKRERDKEVEKNDEVELKKLERQAGIEKRRKARQKDKAARFAGIILLGMVLLIGFLLWIAGEVKQEITPFEYQTGSDTFRVR